MGFVPDKYQSKNAMRRKIGAHGIFFVGSFVHRYDI